MARPLMYRLYVEDSQTYGPGGPRLYWNAEWIRWTVSAEHATLFHEREIPAERHRWGIKLEEVK